MERTFLHQSSLDFVVDHSYESSPDPSSRSQTSPKKNHHHNVLSSCRKEINGETQYVLSRVEDGRTPYLAPEQIIEAHNNGPIDGRTLRAETPKRKDESHRGHHRRIGMTLLEAIRIVESNNNPDAVGRWWQCYWDLSNLGGLPYRCLHGWKYQWRVSGLL